MIIALTGAAGFVGGHVVTALLIAGHEVRALVRRPQPKREGVTWVAGALDDDASLRLLCKGAGAIVHVAGVVNAPDAAGFDAGNRLGTLAMIGAAQASGVSRFVHVSSLAAREPQLSVYGASKRAGEDAVVASPLDWRIVRPPAVYGPGDRDNLELFKLARAGFMPLPPRGRLSLIHAADLAALIVALVERAPSRAFYEPDDARPGGWSHAVYARAIAAAVGAKPLIVPLPRAVLAVGARIDGALRGTRARLTPDRVEYFCHEDWTVDRAKVVPGEVWRPEVDTLQGLADTAAWYRAQEWL